jgi:hypothetical protein
MSGNASVLSTINPIVVYSVLGFYGIFMAAAVLFVYQKFRSANRLLVALHKDWENAQSAHLELLNEAKAKFSSLAPITVHPATPASESRPRTVSFDTRNQIRSMGRKGLSAADIARACSMTEAEINVLLGLSRIQE